MRTAGVKVSLQPSESMPHGQAQLPVRKAPTRATEEAQEGGKGSAQGTTGAAGARSRRPSDTRVPDACVRARQRGVHSNHGKAEPAQGEHHAQGRTAQQQDGEEA